MDNWTDFSGERNNDFLKLLFPCGPQEQVPVKKFVKIGNLWPFYKKKKIVSLVHKIMAFVLLILLFLKNIEIKFDIKFFGSLSWYTPLGFLYNNYNK